MVFQDLGHFLCSYEETCRLLKHLAAKVACIVFIIGFSLLLCLG